MPHLSQTARAPLNPAQVLQRATAATRDTLIPVLHHHLTIPAARGGWPATYAVDLTPDDHGAFLASCSEFPEIRPYSEDEEAALSLVQQAIEDTLGAWRIRLAALS